MLRLCVWDCLPVCPMGATGQALPKWPFHKLQLLKVSKVRALHTHGPLRTEPVCQILTLLKMNKYPFCNHEVGQRLSRSTEVAPIAGCLEDWQERFLIQMPPSYRSQHAADLNIKMCLIVSFPLLVRLFLQKSSSVEGDRDAILNQTV